MIRKKQQRVNYRVFKFLKTTCQACLLPLPRAGLLSFPTLVSVLHLSIKEPALLSANSFPFLKLLESSRWEFQIILPSHYSFIPSG